MEKMKKFTITEDHLKLLRHLWVFQSDDGAPFVDSNRPYGNSNIADDIADILGWEKEPIGMGGKVITVEQEARAEVIHREMGTVLQICLRTMLFSTGTYILADKWDPTSWVKCVSVKL